MIAMSPCSRSSFHTTARTTGTPPEKAEAFHHNGTKINTKGHKEDNRERSEFRRQETKEVPSARREGFRKRTKKDQSRVLTG
jgi:hypothetical protein